MTIKGPFERRRHDVGAAGELQQLRRCTDWCTVRRSKRWLLWFEPPPALKNENMLAISSDDLWCETWRPAKIAAGSPFSQCELAKEELTGGREALSRRQLSRRMKQRRRSTCC